MAVPKIRFPEFSDDWKLCLLEDILTERNVKQTISEDAPLLSFTIEQGVINPEDKKTNKRDFLMKDKSTKIFALTEVDDIIYNPANLKFGAIHRNKLHRGVVSPIYAIFYTNQSPAFVEALVRNPRFIKKSLTFLEGSVIKLMTLKPRDFVKMQVYIPSIEEQKRIADLLNKIDIVIARCQTEIEKTKELKRGLLQKMFPKAGQNTPELRFPGFTEAWEQRKLGEVSERVKGNDGRMDLPTLTISAGSGWLDQKDRFSANIAGKEQENYTLLHKGELSYNHGNSKLAKYGAVFSLRTYEEALVPRVYHSFKVIEADADYIEYLFATKLPDKELGKLISSGARMDGLLNINYDEFMGISISMPSIEEQKKISSYLRSLDSIITLHQRELEKWKELKKGLLQQMFV